MSHSDVLWQILSAFAVILTVLASYLKSRAERKSSHAATTAKIAAVQETVNGNTEHLLTKIDQQAERVDQLGNALGQAGVSLPDKPPPA